MKSLHSAVVNDVHVFQHVTLSNLPHKQVNYDCEHVIDMSCSYDDF